MRRTFLTLLAVLYILLVSGFQPPVQLSAPLITVLDRENQPISQITDGDEIQVQITFAQPATRTETINFSLADTAPGIGSCALARGESSCKTEAFSALGWYWAEEGVPQQARRVQAARNGEALGQSKPIRVSPRPVVLVHGFISNAETWKPYLGAEGFLAALGISGFAVGDGQVSGTLNTGNILEPARRTNTIAQNAEVLGRYIEGVKQMTGAEKIDLVVHSMGGMISRYYIDRVMQERDVAQLIMLGSPMGGSDCAVLPAALGFYLPASIEIRENYMRGIFNRQITRRRGIQFYDLAGTAITDSFQSPCTGVPNDTVVSFGSINAITLESSTLDTIHSNLTFSDAAFNDFVRPLLQKPAGTFLPAPDPAPLPEAASLLQFTRLYTGHVASGSSTELTINIEADLSVASFALYDPSRSVTTIVRGANGNIIELNPETNGFIQLDQPEALFYLGYGFANPRPGPWKITFQSSDFTPPEGTDFAITVYFIGGAILEAASSTLIPQPNEPVEFSAQIALGGQPVDITTAQAVIKDSEGNIETLNFPTGRNISTRWTPTDPGPYAVDIIVTGRAPDGAPIERTAFLAIEVQTNPGKFQITFNLILLILFILLSLSVILRAAWRSVRKLRRLKN